MEDSRTHRYFLLWLGIGIIIIDAVSKAMTNAYIPLMSLSSPGYPYGGIAIFRNFLGIEFSLSHATNRGAAWGVMANFQDWLLAFRIILIGGMLVYVAKFHSKNALAFALIIAGATGNVIDYFIYGHVVDMLHFVLWGYDFPVFNLADTSIFLGIAAFMLGSWFEPKKLVSN